MAQIRFWIEGRIASMLASKFDAPPFCAVGSFCGCAMLITIIQNSCRRCPFSGAKIRVCFGWQVYQRRTGGKPPTSGREQGRCAAPIAAWRLWSAPDFQLGERERPALVESCRCGVTDKTAALNYSPPSLAIPLTAQLQSYQQRH